MKIIQSALKRVGLLKHNLVGLGSNSISLSLRLFLFLVVFVVTIILAVVAILVITGTLTAGITENRTLIENELMHISEEISKEYGQLSLQATEFSKELSSSIEVEATKLGISLDNLHEHPELLEKIISSEYDRVLFALQLSKSSGAFFILDATVNPTLEIAENSRAGLYLRNLEPNIVNSTTPTITVLRGFPSISRSNSLSLHTQWNMEFNISDAPYYHRPMHAASHSNNVSLSSLYYWSNVLLLPNTSDEVMLCAVPLIDSNGNVFGVCGLEISSMLFKLSYMPNRTIYNRLFCLLSPISEHTINFRHSMYAGSISSKAISKDNHMLKIVANNKSLNSYGNDEDRLFLGIHTPITLYPKGSVFYDEQWAVSILIPEEDVVDSVVQINLLLFALLVLLVIFGIVASLFLSRKFLKPISKGIDIIKSKDYNEAPKTQINEIDDLIDFLKTHNEELYNRANVENLSISLLDEFLENTKTLSPAERSVFDLYIENHNAREIADILCLSINTIKTHTKHIYMKLDVTSREELILYANILREIGKEIG